MGPSISILEPGPHMSNEVNLVEPPVTTPTVGKRKNSGDLHEESGEGRPTKKRSKKSGNSKAEPHANWPEYFQNVSTLIVSLLLCRLMRQCAALQGTSSPLCPAARVVMRPLRHSRASIL